MLSDLTGLGAVALTAAFAFSFLAGLVKGTTGFAMPMIMISTLGSFLEPELALAGLILPTLVSNLWQALRQGIRAALDSVWVHWRYLIIVLFFIWVSSQFVTRVPSGVMFASIGILITLFTGFQLAGWQPVVRSENRRLAEFGISALAGTMGGFAGTWGPPTVLYLTALDTPKTEHVRIQGVVYGAGAIVLTLAHLRSGVLAGDGLRLSALMLIPALLGMLLGLSIQDLLDKRKFRIVVLVVLVVAGLNLVRRGMFG